MRTFRSPLGKLVVGSTDGSISDKSNLVINRRYDPDIVIPYPVSPSDVASCLSYQELSDKLSVKYNMRSSVNANGDIEFR